MGFFVCVCVSVCVCVCVCVCVDHRPQLAGSYFPDQGLNPSPWQYGFFCFCFNFLNISLASNFVAALGCSLVVASSGFSDCEAQAPWCTGFSSWSEQA